MSGGARDRWGWVATAGGGSIALGIAIGVAIGSAMGNIALGIAIGVAIGSALAGCSGAVSARRIRTSDGDRGDH